jgi:glycosyltransferase involved in cell wall biosynthesis
VLWRLWGDVDGARRRLEALQPPANFKIERRGEREMAEVYAGVHATACFFSDGFGKSCPNSIIEGLACGRPALVTNTCGIAPLIAEHNAGVSTARSVKALGVGLEQLRADFDQRRIAARRLAERYFGLDGFVRSYASVYADLAA